MTGVFTGGRFFDGSIQYSSHIYTTSKVRKFCFYKQVLKINDTFQVDKNLVFVPLFLSSHLINLYFLGIDLLLFYGFTLICL
ncbi:unnamed protein product [Arabidopsis halleri]